MSKYIIFKFKMSLNTQIIHLKSLADFQALLKNESRGIIIDFYADFCGPCKMIAPFFEKLAASGLNEYVCFCKVDVEEVPDISEHLGVSAMPTFMGFKDEKKVAEVVGANKDSLLNLIKTIGGQNNI